MTVVWKTQSPAGCTKTVAKSHRLDAGLHFDFDLDLSISVVVVVVVVVFYFLNRDEEII